MGRAIQELPEQKQHQAAFNKVANKQDWRAPIDAVVKVEDFESIAEAVMFFTATQLRVDENLGNGMVRAKSPGYRAGPAGDH